MVTSVNRYIAFWRGKRVDVDADTSCRAQQIAARKFKAKQTYEVTVILAEDGWTDDDVRSLLLELGRKMDRVAADTGSIIQRIYVQTPLDQQPRRQRGRN